ncbi:MAG: hypothetical protein Q8M70_05090 [bacterium]|nr:hypothetical protein [bacterium]
MKDFPSKLKELGLKVVKRVEEGIDFAKSSVDSTILHDNLRRRFNLENPYRFIVCEPNTKPSILQTLLPTNAKRYEEDDLFVFFGSKEETKLRPGDIVHDLADSAKYEIKEIETVLVVVSYNNKDYEVSGTAVKCKVL